MSFKMTETTYCENNIELGEIALKNAIISYIKDGEETEETCLIGLELEHFIIDAKTKIAIGYYDVNGVKTTLERLTICGWKSLGATTLIKNGSIITLEPGAQIEISIKADKNLDRMVKVYKDFLDDLLPILKSNGQELLAMGYHPYTKVEDINFIPKERYKYMSDYFMDKGCFALNMMKGTCSVHVALDYVSENDYIQKMRITNCLSPVIAMIFDNSPRFEGETYQHDALRSYIWNNCDDIRCGTIKNAIDGKFSYEQYAEFLLDTPPIIINHKNSIRYTKGTLLKCLARHLSFSNEGIEQIMSMVFPDVRTKKYIEIRTADAVPYPLNFSVPALWKGLLYSNESIKALNELLVHIKYVDVIKAKNGIVENGMDTIYNGMTIKDFALKIITIAENGLDDNEKKYLAPLRILVESNTSVSQIVKLDLAKGIEKCCIKSID